MQREPYLVIGAKGVVSAVRIGCCRLCGWRGLTTVLDLGTMAFTGIFAKPGVEVPRGPLELVECESCGLVQLAHEFPLDLLYGNAYGYRSGLNPSMSEHLRGIALEAWRIARPDVGDVILDIGSNDGTLLNAFPSSANRIGYDPLADKYAEHYAHGIVRHSELFTARSVDVVGRNRAAIVTSIACFYDLPDPVGFARAIWQVLKDGGIWILEMATTEDIAGMAWDQICHEHQEYYSEQHVAEILYRAGFERLSMAHNNANGGSVRIVAKKVQQRAVTPLVSNPQQHQWNGLSERVRATCSAIKAHLEREKAAGRTVWGYGASTKGNVLLQSAGIGPDLLPLIVDANPDKDGCVTPGTGIPIKYDSRPQWNGPSVPDAFLVLPWHFRDFIVKKEVGFLARGGELIFALPEFQVVNKDGVREVGA